MLFSESTGIAVLNRFNDGRRVKDPASFAFSIPDIKSPAVLLLSQSGYVRAT